MYPFVCPVCHAPFTQNQNTLRCENGHSFDMARQGYVNLLMSGKSSKKRRGDDKAMVQARTDFLQGGWYAPLRECVVQAAVKHAPGAETLLDIGCGEGWYTCAVKEALPGCVAAGVDISREALIAAARRDKTLRLAVAGVNHLPVADSSVDVLLNIFAPCDDGEFYRVVRPGGIVIRAVPLEDHLMGLKRAVYDTPYLNRPTPYAPGGFSQLDFIEVRYDITLQNKQDIHNLFLMTPYYYKTSRADQQKLEALEQLTTNLSFGVYVLRKEV